MKRIFRIYFIGCAVVLFAGCGNVYNELMDIPAAEGVKFTMIYVPGGIFPTGTGIHTTAGSGAVDSTVSTPFWIAETEVTYELWFAVRTWARANGYMLNANPGREGNDGAVTAGNGAVPTDANQEPVTTINWREAMVWCNALTEYYNAYNVESSNLDCVYYMADHVTPIRSADDSGAITGTTDGSQDMPYVNTSAKGFRLPRSMEWECAARYKDGTTWTAGTYASGAAADITNVAATGLVSWYFSNCGSVSHIVKSKNANALGIYDLSGNVWEWIFDWHPSYVGTNRLIRGGGVSSITDHLQVGYVTAFGITPTSEIPDLGFRVVRTQ